VHHVRGDPIVRETVVSQDTWILLAVFVGWFVLQRWVLPRLGVRT